MGTPKHTPGPWEILTQSFPAGEIETDRFGVVRRPGAEVYYIRKDVETISYLVGDKKADAHLIAAAPEMLDMLKYLHEKIDSKPGSYEFDVIQGLIAKAEGRA